MKLAFQPQYDTECIIEHSDGLDVTVEELRSAYVVAKENVESKSTTVPAGIIHPEEIHTLTLQEIENIFPSVRAEDIETLANTVEVPVSHELTPVFTQTFCDALSVLGKWQIQERTESLSQGTDQSRRPQSNNRFDTQVE